MIYTRSFFYQINEITDQTENNTVTDYSNKIKYGHNETIRYLPLIRQIQKW